MTETPPFDESLASFLRFVGGEGFSTELVWVFREDVTNCIRDYWVRVPVPAGNEALARDYFEYGRQQARGVTLEVMCRLGGRSACYVWVPEDDEAASYAMQGPLKLKVPAEPVEGVGRSLGFGVAVPALVSSVASLRAVRRDAPSAGGGRAPNQALHLTAAQSGGRR